MKAKEYLSQRGVDYEEFDVGADKKAAKEMITISGARSVPVITVEDEVIIGFDPSKLEAALTG